MKIYTKRGDKGQTSLFGGKSVAKSSVRLHAYGTVDELNSVLGLTLSSNPSERGRDILITLQEQLFVLGADLATLQSKKTKIKRIGDDEIAALERFIDELDNQLPPLTSFILPGGHSTGASLHLARTVCRRAERHAVQLKENEDVSDFTIIYLNRLSDLLFVLARFENQKANAEEIKWLPK